jgi:hypothetical protein
MESRSGAPGGQGLMAASGGGSLGCVARLSKSWCQSSHTKTGEKEGGELIPHSSLWSSCLSSINSGKTLTKSLHPPHLSLSTNSSHTPSLPEYLSLHQTYIVLLPICSSVLASPYSHAASYKPLPFSPPFSYFDLVFLLS